MTTKLLAFASVVTIFSAAQAFAASDLIFYEGNGCSQDIVFAYDSFRPADDNCQDGGACDGDNDEARSMRILRSVSNGATLLVYDSPDADETDDWTKIVVHDNSFIPPEGYCLRSFKQNFLNPSENFGIQVEYINKNGLDGKISRVRVLPGSIAQPLTAQSAIHSGAGKCLDVHAPDQNNNGGRVQVWDCNGSIQQSWSVEGQVIRSGAGKCLDVHAPDQNNNGGRVQVWDCNGSIQQTWVVDGSAIRSGAGKCLDVHAPDQNNNGAAVQVWDCNGTIQQTWRR